MDKDKPEKKLGSKKVLSVAMTVIMLLSVFAAIIPGIASQSSDTSSTAEQTKEIDINELQQLVYEQGYNYTVAKNWITDLSPEEREALCGYRQIEAEAQEGPLPENVRFVSDVPKAETGGVGLPASYDAMALGYVTPIRNQGPCGSCWIFGAIADFESDVAIGESNLFDFSEQEVGDGNIWSREGGYNFCWGGNTLMTVESMRIGHWGRLIMQ
jgi:C1A family cysteine protease